jgi:hypothetical protein
VAPSKDLPANPDDKLAVRRAAEQDVLLREVDEAVRQQEFLEATRRYGWAIGLGFVLLLAAFGGWLWWREHRETQLETRSEKLVTAFDALEAGNLAQGKAQLAPIVDEGGPAGSAAARLSLAAIALRENRRPDAFKQYEAVAADDDVPQPYRDLATIRLMTARFDELKPDAVIARLKPLAQQGKPWFGTAGELVAMAYLKQGRNDLAGPLLAQIAKDESVVATTRARTRQLAGLLGYDAVVDVSQTLTQLQQEEGGPAAVPAPATAPAQ